MAMLNNQMVRIYSMSEQFFAINIQQPRLFFIMIHPLPRFNVSKAAVNHPYFDGLYESISPIYWYLWYNWGWFTIAILLLYWDLLTTNNIQQPRLSGIMNHL